MDWAVVRQGQSRPDGVLMLVDNRSDAESIVAELRRRGQPVEVATYSDGIVMRAVSRRS